MAVKYDAPDSRGREKLSDLRESFQSCLSGVSSHCSISAEKECKMCYRECQQELSCENYHLCLSLRICRDSWDMATISALLLSGHSGFVFSTGVWILLQGSLESFHRIPLEEVFYFSTSSDSEISKYKVQIPIYL